MTLVVWLANGWAKFSGRAARMKTWEEIRTERRRRRFLASLNNMTRAMEDFAKATRKATDIMKRAFLGEPRE